MQDATPDIYQPRLTIWSHLWRLLLCLTLSGLVWSSTIQGQWEDHRPLFWLDIGVGLVAYVLVQFRRRWPLPVALAITLMSTVSAIAAGPSTLATVSLATRRIVLQIVVIGIALVISAQIFSSFQPLNSSEPFWLTFTVNLIITAASLAWGMYIGSRRELLWTLRERAERAEAEQELRTGKARGDERARIAREMHDVLAHRISQVSMHAGALAFRDDLSAEDMRASAGVIQEQANAALTDLRAVLGVLRDPVTGELQNRPQPTYADVAALVEEAREVGMHVQYDDTLGDAESVPTPIGRTVYRIVQEGLTNARKHAPGSTVFVQVSGAPEEGIDVLLRNPIGFGPQRLAVGSGLGLVGLAERAELGGGRLEHRKDGSMFILHGWIPWTA